ncbi:thiopeptide-type bacteriocin biosynthesis protein [Pseudofrankia sp. BMG5.37]|nr:thiopeptide-type bacteriocin biosynthesis protein [Pseudofrankia sp. BMG5.36]MDT3446607.1 thiopeptide-type bacteriocin biosynthesis protein [Pseudofrankia sp. BMG5.37]
MFRNLARTGDLAATVPEIYEPDPHPFGGLTGTKITHDRADSEAILAHLRQDDPPLRRPELSAMLLDTLLKAAGLDRPTRRDLYTRLAATRPTPDPTSARRLGAELLAVLAEPASDLATFASWRDGYATAGSRLADATATGHLTCELTDVLTSIVDSHWNRLGLTIATQSTLAHAATHAYLTRG